ncbi:MAG: hypothetical protein G8237_03820 [Magnetococcales bacterium]|nr:hypothetical protein [Magnetococcales bacterium]
MQPSAWPQYTGPMPNGKSKFLFANGAPASVDELRERFDQFLNGLVKGKEPGKVRIVLENGS